ncbi:MAG: ABC transporter substrate-binding protein [Chlamydiales bacterium]
MRNRIILFFSCFAFLVGIWECGARLLSHMKFILPAPSGIFFSLVEMPNEYWVHTLCTLKEMCGGFLLALTAAFPLAWTMMRYEPSRTLLQPLFIIIQCLPMFTLAPIMVIWFGWSYTAIVIPTALMIFFPLTLNIYQGLRSTPQDLLEFFQANQATPWQTFFKLHLPWATPHIFAGFRISSAIAGVGAVAGEWAGAQKGLGILMLESRRNIDLEITFGALFCLTVISSLLYGMILVCEKLALPPRHWKVIFKQSSLQLTPIKKHKKQLVLPLFCMTFFLFGLFGFLKQNGAKPTRLLLDWLPNPNHVPLYVALEKGFFEAEGIDLTIQKMHDNGGGIAYLTSYQADLLVTHLPAAFKAASRGAHLKIAGLLIKEPLRGLIYHDDPSVKTTADLSAKRLGYCIGGPDTSFLEFLMKQGNIEPSERKNVSVDLISAMGTHSVDFIYGAFWNIEPVQLHSLGVSTHYFKIQDLGVPTYYEMIIVGNADTPQTSPEALASFQRALQKGIDFCKQHPEVAFSSYLAHNPGKRAKTIAWERKAWENTYPLFAESQSLEAETLSTFYQWQLNQGFLHQPFDFQNMICNNGVSER